MKYHWQYATVRQCVRCLHFGRWIRPDLCSTCALHTLTKHPCAFCKVPCQARKTHCFRCVRAGIAPARIKLCTTYNTSDA